MNFQAIIDQILLLVTKARNLYTLSITAIDIIMNEGWGSFYLHFKAKLRDAVTARYRLWLRRPEHAGKQMSLETKHCPTVRRYKVLFIIGPSHIESTRYRVYNMIEAARNINIEAQAALEVDINEQFGWMMKFDIVVIFRAAWSDRIERLVQACRVANVIIVIDIDDYIFEIEIMPFIDGIRKWGAARRKRYEDVLKAYRKTLLQCDYAITTTEYLASRIEELGKQCFVVRNTVNWDQIEISRDALYKTADRTSDTIRIGYLSGTFTHQKDFAVAVPALSRILQEFTNTELIIVGLLDMGEFPELKQFENRIKQIPFTPWRDLPYQIAETDINIAPLEVNNPFCEAKSELKYFEAALLKKPVVASATATFKFCIENGGNGFLASNSEEFYENLKKLITDERLRQEIGENSYTNAMNTYSPFYLAEAIKETYSDIIQIYRERTLNITDRILSISFVVPSPFAGSGGHKTIFLAANYLAEAGHWVSMYFIDDRQFKTRNNLREFVSSNFLYPKFEIILGTDSILCCDALFATHWSTAYVVRENRQSAAKCFYFVQDFEPQFYPMSAEYLKAEHTYKFGFYCVTMGPWLNELMRNRYGGDADFIPFWIEDRYRPRDRKELRNRIAFFSRPQMPRRCFELGLDALQILYKRNPKVEITLFGSNEVNKFKLPFKHTSLGILARDDLAKLYSNIDCGLAFSTTNPSFVPYEMMAAKCPVVDLAVDPLFDEMRYGSSENVALVEPEPESIALKLEEILGSESLRTYLAENGHRFVSSFPTQEEAFSKMEQILRRELGV
jgi:glycosyltransferase involved in cell wall biosynthesis